jgi:hypothetical protein
VLGVSDLKHKGFPAALRKTNTEAFEVRVVVYELAAIRGFEVAEDDVG